PPGAAAGRSTSPSRRSSAVSTSGRLAGLIGEPPWVAVAGPLWARRAARVGPQPEVVDSRARRAGGVESWSTERAARLRWSTPLKTRHGLRRGTAEAVGVRLGGQAEPGAAGGAAAISVPRSGDGKPPNLPKLSSRGIRTPASMLVGVDMDEPATTPLPGGHRAAAFFDLDKTVIAKSSALAFSRSFYQGGL